MEDGIGEDLIASERVELLASLEVLHPCEDEGSKFWNRDVVCSGVEEFVEVSPPSSRE